MTLAKNKSLFWCLLAAQVASAGVVLWKGLPIYRHLVEARHEGATPDEFWVACLVILVMQVAYWLAYRLQPNLRFSRNVVLAHVLLWLSELSYFFPHALAALCLFDRFQEVEEMSFFPERLALLAALLFAMYCFKHQLEALAEAMSESEPSLADGNRSGENASAGVHASW